MLLNFAKQRIKKIISTYKSLSYHEAHRKEAIKILKKVEMQKGKISQYARQKCDEYATDVLGSKIYSPWLYVYTAIANEFKEGWIPDNFYGAIVVKKQKGDYGKISLLKTLNNLIFESRHFPDILSYVNGVFFDACYKPI